MTRAHTSRTTRTLSTLALVFLPALGYAQTTGAMQDKDKMKKEADAMGKMDDKMGKMDDKMGKMGDKMGSAMGGMSDAKSTAFRGVGDHLAAGTYILDGAASALRLTTSKDFAHDPRAADVYLVLAKGSMVSAANGLFHGKVSHASGVTSLKIPANSGLEEYDTLVLWRKKLNTAVGTAPFDMHAHR